MNQDQIFQLKITVLQLAQGNLDQAKTLFTWVTEEAKAAEETIKEQRRIAIERTQEAIEATKLMNGIVDAE